MGIYITILTSLLTGGFLIFFIESQRVNDIINSRYNKDCQPFLEEINTFRSFLRELLEICILNEELKTRLENFINLRGVLDMDDEKRDLQASDFLKFSAENVESYCNQLKNMILYFYKKASDSKKPKGLSKKEQDASKNNFLNEENKRKIQKYLNISSDDKGNNKIFYGALTNKATEVLQKNLQPLKYIKTEYHRICKWQQISIGSLFLISCIAICSLVCLLSLNLNICIPFIGSVNIDLNKLGVTLCSVMGCAFIVELVLMLIVEHLVGHWRENEKHDKFIYSENKNNEGLSKDDGKSDSINGVTEKNEDITEVIFNEGKSYSGFTKLKKVKFKVKHSDIPYQAFAETYIRSINLSNQGKKSDTDNNVEIGEGVFLNCNKLEKVLLPKKLGEIPLSLFRNCQNLKSLHIPKTVTKIGQEAFAHCSLKKIKLPHSLKVIEKKAFYRNVNIKRIIIPKNVNSIGAKAFWGCLCLKEVVFCSEVQLEDSCFGYCCNLESIIVPNGTIEHYKTQLDDNDMGQLKNLVKENKNGVFRKALTE